MSNFFIATTPTYLFRESRAEDSLGAVYATFLPPERKSAAGVCCLTFR